MQIKLIVVVVYIRILFFGPRLMYSYFSADFSGGGSRILFRTGCTRLLLYFNTNRPHSFFFLQNTSCIRKPQVISENILEVQSNLHQRPPLHYGYFSADSPYNSPALVSTSLQRPPLYNGHFLLSPWWPL